PNRAESLYSIAYSIMERYLQTNSRADLDLSIVYNEEALQLRAVGHPDRAQTLHELAYGTLERYRQCRSRADLDLTIIQNEEALQLRNVGHPDRAITLLHLGFSMRHRYEATKDRVDLDLSIKYFDEALQLRPTGNPDRAVTLHSLAYSILERYLQSHDRADLDLSITHNEEALKPRAVGHPGRAQTLHELAYGTLERYKRYKIRTDLDLSIVYNEEALQLRSIGTRVISTKMLDSSTSKAPVKQIVIIGSGVIGLTAAYELSTHHAHSKAQITVIARDMPHGGLDSTGWASPWAGANWFPFVNRDPENKWEKVSWRKFNDKSVVPEELVVRMPTKFYSTRKDQAQDLWYHEEVGDLKPLPEPWPMSVPGSPPTASAFELTTLTVCVPQYLLWLQDEATKRGVKFVKGWVGSVADVEFVPGTENQIRTDVVINASGLGAKQIIGVEDALVFPIRGQTILVRAPQIKWSLLGFSLYDNKLAKETIYVIPRRNGDVIVGGTFQEGNWDVSPDPDTARRILEVALNYCPELVTRSTEATGAPKISDMTILRHSVGLRPARKGGARVERQIITMPNPHDSSELRWSDMAPVPNGLSAGQSTPILINGIRAGQDKELKMRVVHAYGVGPAGYQMSWGIAEDVVKLVNEFFHED
ncbi:hypothetical protein FRB98_001052, partial [Tulasnella sp. 332]